jgi:hypothetical protein
LKIILIFCLIFSTSSFALVKSKKKIERNNEADRKISPFHLDINSLFMSRSITTEASASTTAENSSALDQAIELKFSYLFGKNSALVYGYQRNFGVISEGQSSGQRFGYRYYFTNSPLSDKLVTPHLVLKTTGTLHWFAQGDFKTRDFEISSSILRFNGPGVAGGCDIMMGKAQYITTMLEYDMLSNGEIRTLSSFNFSIGIGFIL